MRIAVVPDGEGGGRLCELGSDAVSPGDFWHVSDLAGVIADYEAHSAEPPRWVWSATEDVYPPLVEHMLRVGRCHDVTLVEALLLGYEGHFGQGRSLGAAWARLHGREAPVEPGHREAMVAPRPPMLFTPDRSLLPAGVDQLAALVEVHADQLRRIASVEHPERFALLAAVESAGALTAVEMSNDGVPWRADVHDELLTQHLGPRPLGGGRPPVLVELEERINEAFGLGRSVNPDSPAQVLEAFQEIGYPLPSTRSWVLSRVDHPVVPLLLRYKELSRLYTSHGWAWLERWVRHGRFRPDYVVGGVVSGRWATRGGGAQQIPKLVRRAVIADPGWRLVTVDAGQLEPRILAAVSGDRRLAEAAADSDLYTWLAGAFGGDRDRAKLAVLAAMYGQREGDAAASLRTMRRFFPRAMEYLDNAARAGKQGRLVRSWLGRTCPPPSPLWQRSGGASPRQPPSAHGVPSRAVAERGRFTRNFVIQATAAEWALVFMAGVRRRLSEIEASPAAPQLVFFQHDELVLHVPQTLVSETVAALREAELETRRLLFGRVDLRFPLDIAIVECYADA
ncbi:bifunctional 3'-5' exonuclease/DNA polymerase [Salinactinospora qingdaonensis]|uniref:DNA-directed DNA polymerase n=1 Tax=Salinactinospora qingdaonensis TaxID=702744 RepID=A0ABP7EX81_9ACTN